MATLTVAFCFLTRSASAEDVNPDELTSISLEQLMDVRVSSPSRREEGAFGAASSVHVITSEDIRRSGAANIPEALRLVPGLQVTRVDANSYTITSRGLGDLPASDKLLVLLDGRAVYSPTNSMVWWQSVQYPLEDIDHIEVVLGPGSAVWGANANNGVINIISKKAEKTQGLFLSAGAGNLIQGSFMARYGAKAGENGAFRAYLSAEDANAGRRLSDVWHTDAADAGSIHNPRQNRQAGFRYDSETGGSRMTLHGNVYENHNGSEGSIFQGVSGGEVNFGQFVNDDRFAGKNLLWRFEGDFEDASSASLQLYYDNVNTRTAFFEETLDTADGEAQVDYRGFTGQTLSAGFDYRFTRTHFVGTLAMQMPDVQLNLLGLFVQDEIRGFGDRLKAVLGAKLEKNDYTGWEFQPTAKISWVENRWMTWASAARSVRLANPVNSAFSWNQTSGDPNPNGNGFNTLKVLQGTSAAAPEEVYAFELGGRSKIKENENLDVSLYFNHYPNVMDNVNTGQWATLGTPGNMYNIQYSQFLNVYEGDGYGGDLVYNWRPYPWLRAYAGYGFARIVLKPKPGQEVHQQEADWINTATPVETTNIGLFMDLPGKWKLDTFIYVVSDYFGVSTHNYARWDARLAWVPDRKFEVSMVGRNLGLPLHKEHESSIFFDPAFVQQELFLTLTYKY